MQTGYVLQILRESQKNGLQTLSIEEENELVAKLNDMAYQVITKGGMQKLIDKRAMVNEQLYQKLEMEIREIIRGYDFFEITKRW